MLLTLSFNGNMFNGLVLLLLYMLYIPLSVADQSTNDPNKMLNSCLDGMHHKTEPGPEGDLYKQCSPWRDRSCCRYNTTEAAHNAGLYGFKLDHCTNSAKMSKDCRRHFLQDLCFYECSPNIGPWVVKDSGMKIRKERYFEVPLCQSDCEAWFESCYDDYTCTDNWSRNFNWSDGRNHCPAMSECRTFGSIYGTAGNFCSKVWDHSWKPVPDEEPCMRLWFNPDGGNPNERVAQIYAERMKNMGLPEAFICSKAYILTFVLIFLSVLF